MASRRILYLQYTNPCGYPPLEHSSTLLADDGWDVLFLGQEIAEVEKLRFPPHPRVKTKLLPKVQSSWSRKLNYVRYTVWALAQAIKFRPRWIYASDALSCPAALAVHSALGIPIVYHEHDAPGSRLPAGFAGARLRLAKLAAACVVPNRDRLEKFRAETHTARPLFCVWNCPEKKEIPPLVPRKNEELLLFYHGSLVPSRLPLSLLEAMQGLPVRLDYAGYFPSGAEAYKEEIRQKASELNLGDRVRYLGVQQRREILAHDLKADVGIAILPLRSASINESRMVGASNKVFEYLASGMAVLLPDSAEWKAAFDGVARFCDPSKPESIRESLKWFIDHPKDRAHLGERGRELCLEKWNYETQFAPVKELLERQ